MSKSLECGSDLHPKSQLDIREEDLTFEKPPLEEEHYREPRCPTNKTSSHDFCFL